MMEKKPLGASYWQQLAGRGKREHLREEIRDLLVCPDDLSPLEFRTKDDDYRCPTCERRFQEESGILSVLPSGDPYQLSAEERQRQEELAAATARPVDPSEAFGPLWHKALDVAGPVSGKRVLDVCCGTGWASAELAARGAVSCASDVVMGEGGLTSAKQLRQERGVAVDLVHADVARLPFQDESFDLVFLARTLHVLRRPERLLREVGRVMKPKGIVINMGEPIGERGAPHIGRTDPRREGRELSLADYEGMYREAQLRMTPLFAEDPGTGTKRSVLRRIGDHLRHHRSAGERLFVATR
jgi:SAM-dependent methyltransferase